MRLFLHLAVDLALRHGTILRLTPAAWSKANDAITFVTKNQVQQTLPLTPEVRALLELAPAPGLQAVQQLKGSSKPVTPEVIERAWQKLKAAAQANPQLTIHDLRRTAAEQAWNATHDLRRVQFLLGHASIATTAHYLARRADLSNLRETVQAMQDTRGQRHGASQTP